MWLAHPPKFIKDVYPSLYWNILTDKKEIFITFDDGPTPGVTEEVLEMLQQYNAKATFFCLGKNVSQSPKLFQHIRQAGHAVGSHTYNHKNGWKTQRETYYREVKFTEEVFETNLFRPPYGRIRPTQIRTINKDYHIIMWTNLSMDFSNKHSKEDCLRFSLKDLDKGSIIVFHDSVKAKERMFYALEGVLQYCQQNNWACSAINL